MSCQILLSVTSMETSTPKSYNLIVTVKCLNCKYKNFIQICTKHIKNKKKRKKAEKKAMCEKVLGTVCQIHKSEKFWLWSNDHEMYFECKKMVTMWYHGLPVWPLSSSWQCGTSGRGEESPPARHCVPLRPLCTYRTAGGWSTLPTSPRRKKDKNSKTMLLLTKLLSHF